MLRNTPWRIDTGVPQLVIPPNNKKPHTEKISGQFSGDDI